MLEVSARTAAPPAFAQLDKSLAERFTTLVFADPNQAMNARHIIRESGGNRKPGVAGEEGEAMALQEATSRTDRFGESKPIADRHLPN